MYNQGFPWIKFFILFIPLIIFFFIFAPSFKWVIVFTFGGGLAIWMALTGKSMKGFSGRGGGR